MMEALSNDVLLIIVAHTAMYDRGVLASVHTMFRTLLPGPYITDPTTSVARFVWSGVAGTKRYCLRDVCRNGSLELLQYIWNHLDEVEAPFGAHALTRDSFCFPNIDRVTFAFEEMVHHDRYDLIAWLCKQVCLKNVWPNYWLLYLYFDTPKFVFFLRLLEENKVTLDALDWGNERVYETLACSCVEMIEWFFAHCMDQYERSPATFLDPTRLLKNVMYVAVMADGHVDTSAAIDFCMCRLMACNVTIFSSWNRYKIFCEILIKRMNKSRVLQMHGWGVPTYVNADYLSSFVNVDMAGNMERVEFINDWIQDAFA